MQSRVCTGAFILVRRCVHLSVCNLDIFLAYVRSWSRGPRPREFEARWPWLLPWALAQKIPGGDAGAALGIQDPTCPATGPRISAGLPPSNQREVPLKSSEYTRQPNSPETKILGSSKIHAREAEAAPERREGSPSSLSTPPPLGSTHLPSRELAPLGGPGV